MQFEESTAAHRKPTWLHTTLSVAAAAVLGIAWLALPAFADEPKPGENDTKKKPNTPRRSVPWTTSRVVGSPEPPPPYRLKRVFPKLKFEEPVHMLPEPGTNRLWVAEGKGKIRAFENSPDASTVTDIVDLALPGLRAAPYGMLFHPNYAENGQVFLFLEVKRNIPEGIDGRPAPVLLPTTYDEKPYERLLGGAREICRVSRFRTTPEHPRRIIRESEEPIVDWKCSGHTGGGIAFGADGMLYITTGDGTSDSDGNITGQDLTDLQGGVLRIDVDHPTGGRPYGIPGDNPFLDIPGARPELYAFGLRAPWRMTYDAPTNQFWIGEVGQDLWEQIHLLKRGANYGWSVREGNHPFQPERPAGPVSFTGPIVEHHHTEARSITGGYVYRGSKRPELQEHYIYCDYETGKVWAFRYVGGQVLNHRELTDTSYKVPTFGIDHARELYLVAYSGEIFELEPRDTSPGAELEFPRKLSETGLFYSTSGRIPAPGLVPYSVNVPVWHDGARMERYIAIPGDGQMTMTETRGWTFPDRSVVVQTLFLDSESGVSSSQRPIETRILTRQDGEWEGYSYAWNEQLTDADLVAGGGIDHQFVIKDPGSPGGARRQTWHFPSRTECMGCHSRAAAWVLGVSTPQLNLEERNGQSSENQLVRLERLGFLDKPLAKAPSAFIRLTNPHDVSGDLTARARSYLQANCAHCHVAAGGGNARLELEFATTDEKSMLFVDPLHGAFGLPQGKVVARGEPARSVLLYRVAKLGRGRMPHLGSSVVDVSGTGMFFDWITSLAPAPADEPSAETAQRMAAHRRDLEALRSGNPDVATPFDRLLAGVDGALLILNDLARNRLPKAVAAEAIRRGATHPDSTVRDLFEQFLPEEQRIPRLGTSFDPQTLLAGRGDAARGESLFFNAAGMQCKNCHVIKGKGASVGPDLSTVGQKQSREQILQNLLEPSKVIDEKYKTWLVATTEGRVHTGILVEKTAEKVVLRDAQNQLITVPADRIDALNAQSISLMPTMLLRDLTLQQARDLIEFLHSLK